MDKKGKVWQFVQAFYPGYLTDDIAKVEDDLYALLNQEEADESSASALYMEKYAPVYATREEATPAIQADLHIVQLRLLHGAIEGYKSGQWNPTGTGTFVDTMKGVLHTAYTTMDFEAFCKRLNLGPEAAYTMKRWVEWNEMLVLMQSWSPTSLRNLLTPSEQEIVDLQVEEHRNNGETFTESEIGENVETIL